jgi:hypothetical protein
VSIEQHRCYTLTCDSCRHLLETPDGYTPHYDSPDAALDDALHEGWQLDTDGHLICDRCVATAACAVDGHDFTPWWPCPCRALIPDHAAHGCGLLRICHRCDLTEATTLAALPTTDEPPGR